MKFFIDGNSYFRREEQGGTFSIMIRATNQTIRMNRSSRPLFERTDEWTDLSSFVRELNVPNVPLKQLERDYAAALFRLHAHGATKIKDFPPSEESGFRKAEAADYYRLSKFCLDNKNSKYSVAQTLNEAFYDLYATYDRLLNPTSFVIINMNCGKIEACAMFSLSKRNFGGLVVNLDTVIFHENLSENDTTKQLLEMLEVAKMFAKGKATKIRYEKIHPRQDFLAKQLVEIGFKQTAIFPNELQTGQDLILYDCLLRACW